MIKILVVDDHQVLIDGIKAMLSHAKHIQIAGEALSGREALEIIEELPELDLVLLDINLPDINGFEVCQKIKKQAPDLKILTLTMHQDHGYISKMIKSGANGYILKNTGKEELVKAIETVVDGDKYYSKQVTERLLEGLQNPKKSYGDFPIPKLTRREKEILKLVVDELTTEQIAEKLFISSTTVISHRKSLLRKLNAKNTAGIVKAAYEYNLLD